MSIGAFRKAAWTVRFPAGDGPIFRRNADGQRAAVGFPVASRVERVLRPGGTQHFLEHGLAPEEKVARLQKPAHTAVAPCLRGRHLDRPILQLVAGAGLELTQMKAHYLMGLRAFGYTLEGGQPSEGSE